MRLTALALATMALGASTLAADDKAGGDAAKERERFHGTWTIVSVEHGGKKAELPDASTVVFEGGKYRIKAGDETVEEGTFEVDASKSPYHISVMATSGRDKGKTWHGVYELRGDTLRAVVGPADGERPRRLTDPGPGTRSFTVKRQANAAKP